MSNKTCNKCRKKRKTKAGLCKICRPPYRKQSAKICKVNGCEERRIFYKDFCEKHRVVSEVL